MNTFRSLAYCVGALFILTGCANASLEERPLVEAGDMVITQGEFYEALKSSAGTDTFRHLLLNRLLTNYYTVSDDEIKKEIEHRKIEQGLTSDKAFNKALQENGQTYDAFYEATKQDLLLEQARLDGVDIPTDAIEAEYKRIQHFVRARHILVKDRALANDLYDQLQHGASFEELAATHSIDRATRAKGGDLGFFGQDYFIDAIEKTAFQLPIGEISQPIESAYGFHLIQVTEKNRTYDELKETIESMLRVQQKKSVDEVFADLIKKENVTLYDASLQDALQ